MSETIVEEPKARDDKLPHRFAFAGMTLWIAWNINALILSPHSLSSSQSVIASYAQLPFMLGFVCGALVIVLLGERRLVDLGKSRLALVPLICFVAAMLAFYLVSFPSAQSPSFFVANLALGASGMIITILWMGVLSGFHRDNLIKLMGWTSVLGAVLSLLLFLLESTAAGSALDAGVALSSLIFLLCAQHALDENAAAQQHPVELLQKRFVMPKNILISSALFTGAVGIIAAVYARLEVISDSAPMQTGWEAVGMAIAAGAFLTLNGKRINAERAGRLTLRITLILLTCGLFLLQITSFSVPIVSNAAFAGGFVLFYLYIKTVYFEISRQTPALPLVVFAQAFLANYLANLLGGVVVLLLPDLLLEQPYLSLLMLGIYLVLVLTEIACFTDANISTCWGLLSPESEETPKKKDKPYRLAVDALAEEHSLTLREKEVLLLLARGYRVAQIESTLGISYGTVRTHINHIYAKLQIHTYADLCNLIELKRKSTTSGFRAS